MKLPDLPTTMAESHRIKMEIDTMWKQEIAEEYDDRPLLILIDALSNAARGDDYDGAHTDRGFWEYAYLFDIVSARVAKLLAVLSTARVYERDDRGLDALRRALRDYGETLDMVDECWCCRETKFLYDAGDEGLCSTCFDWIRDKTLSYPKFPPISPDNQDAIAKRYAADHDPKIDMYCECRKPDWEGGDSDNHWVCANCGLPHE